jgi:hypothetical protein
MYLDLQTLSDVTVFITAFLGALLVFAGLQNRGIRAASGAPSSVPIIAPDRMGTDAESVGRRRRVASSFICSARIASQIFPSALSTSASLLPAIFVATNNTAAIFDFHFEQNRGLHHTNGKA